MKPPADETKLVRRVAGIEVYSDIPSERYNAGGSHAESIAKCELRFPLIKKKIIKRVKVDELKERQRIHRTRVNLHLWLFDYLRAEIA